MKVFVLSCLAAIVITVAANLILTRTVPFSSEQTYTLGTNVRIGAAGDGRTATD